MLVDTTPAHARLVSVAGYRPRARVGNAELVRAGALDTSDEWIRQRTGITARHLADDTEPIEYLGARAARTAVRRAGLAMADIDCVIAATMSHARHGRSLARGIADRLTPAPRAALDVNAACAGFCYALEMARTLIGGRTFERIVVVGAERMSDIVDHGDRTTRVIFADGAGAAVVCRSGEPGIAAPVWGSDTACRDFLTRPAGAGPDGARAPWTPGHLKMQGPALYRWVHAHVPEAARAAVRRAGVRLEDLRVFVPHQANDRMISGIVAALDLPPTVTVARDITRTGNTSAASIPLALDALLHRDPTLSGELALLIGFGAGLSYAAQVVVVP
ncbi:beta-ketoacyl-ACP synthase 3 [Streptantibioticus cattleyicolor]|uniref:3-oxoacyl-[acyl-carrier-protein] synthase III n=1 Tax=Streptantibioticus cattleyicolor (strain ATCC 35852 / DSM 46488 / JCM 4925 / NBRC 14057 / NRRL 8057) TaxID=1003195 RepID=F8JNG9_STREN|nr:beta-ketoacyl-ACP synthase 3 [Streptantibioticus cattleyicolor]AEW99063.1 3-oxoacyl-[acyl-carrier-protein] synthase III [Streptantibioticus cattleyicolor NRRL 8057 = DSM 46488]CCB71889.1 3-oxoacyl-[acyl-carrier-protein] synthase 3 [Streptantibioticus cattleyicolor NRRL 8057 = DSM 46488]